MAKTFVTITSQNVIVKRSSENREYAFVVVDLDGHWPEFASSRELAAKKYTTRAGKGRPVELLQVYELLKNLKGRLICKEEIGYLVIEPDGTYEHFTTTAPLKDFLVGLQDCYKSGGHQ